MGTEPKKNVVDAAEVPVISAEGEQSAVLVNTAQLAQLNTLTKVSTKLSESGMFPSLKNPGQYLAVVLAGNERGYGPMTSLTNIHIINGRFGYSAQMIGAELRKAGVTYDVVETDSSHCKICFHRKGQQDFTYEWTTEDATRAKKLPGKPDSVWTTYPQDMLFARCLTGGGRKFAPDAIMGCYLADEIPEVFDQPEITNDSDKTATENLADKIKARAENSGSQEKEPADSEPPADQDCDLETGEVKEPELKPEPEPQNEGDNVESLLKLTKDELVKKATQELATTFSDNPKGADHLLSDAVTRKTLNDENIASDKNNKGQLANLIVDLQAMRQKGAGF